MDYQKIFCQIGSVAILILVMVLAPALAASQPEHVWQSWTSYREVRDLELAGDNLYVATSGGLLVVTSTQLPGTQYTNVDGLGTNDIRDVLVDADDQVWLAAPGRLIRFDADNSRSYLFMDENDQALELYSLADDGEYLWVGTEVGLVLFSKTTYGGQIEDSYGRFDDLSDFPAVNSILVEGDTIWIATSAGLAVADISSPRDLKKRSHWTAFGSDVLGTGLINEVVRFESDLYVATGTGLRRLDISAADTVGTLMPIYTGYHFSSLKIEQDSLFFYSSGGMGAIVSGTATSLGAYGLPAQPVTGITFDGQRWLGLATHGLYYSSDGTYTNYPYTGLPGGNVSDLTVNAEGTINAAFTNISTSVLIDGLWEILDFSIGARSLGMMTDRDGTSYTGTHGNGLWLHRDDSMVNYDETNSTMLGNNDALPGSLAYVVIYGLASNDRYLFVACYRAANGYPIAIADLDNIDDRENGWDSMGVFDGINTDRVQGLAWHNGQLAIGSESQGLFVCDIGDDPFERPSNSCQRLTKANSYLRSDIVNVVKYAPDGTLWAGTSVGLSRYDIGIERFVDVDLPAGIDRTVTDMEFDGRGNLWVGTTGGVARFDASDGTFEIFTTANSGLVDDDIRAVTLDPWTGRTYFGTSAGISWLESFYGAPQDNIKDVIAFPNPFVIRSGDDYLSFDFARAGTVTIYTVNGQPVREMNVDDRWYGRNQSGAEVASGVYLFTIVDNNGNVGRGKVLLVRE
jgi:hypothetical protein